MEDEVLNINYSDKFCENVLQLRNYLLHVFNKNCNTAEHQFVALVPAVDSS